MAQHKNYFFSGYGHVTPLSREGKVFCIVYAVVGIPLTLVLISAVVARLQVPAEWLHQWLKSRLSDMYDPFVIRVLHFAILSKYQLSFPEILKRKCFDNNSRFVCEFPEKPRPFQGN